ncbi:MAG: acetyl-CoA carboxylase biotin carboxylase subunit, partial [bacterium]
THLYQGYTISPYFDSLVAKLIAWGSDREEAIARMRRALNEFIVEGIATTIPLHLQIINTSEFCSGDFSTQFLEQYLSENRAILH